MGYRICAMYFYRRLIPLIFLLCGFIGSEPLLAQPKPKLRPLRIALPSHTIAATHFYVGRSLGVFESHGFDPQILVLEPRAALAALMTGDLDFYTATGTTTRAALRNVPVRVIMVGLNRPDHVLVASKEISSIDQLRGKVLGGYTAQATVNTVLIELLRRRGLRPDEYKILNVGTARLGALVSGNVPAAVLNGLETAKAVKQGFRVLARAADEIELATGGLGTSVQSIQTKREVFRPVVQAVLESIRISATQKERVVPILMKQFSLPQEDVSLVLDIVQKGWALDGRPTPGSQKFEFDLAQKEMGLKEAPKPEQVYDFSILDEVGKR
ncbi:MAG TPA: ABC transporter substrate-binding protein [Candidatus Binatia bacterium]|nr:ABC transporter substrate-binding protein [Candidatus Binatia bacterium]